MQRQPAVLRVANRDCGPDATSGARRCRAEVVKRRRNARFAGVTGQADQKLLHFNPLPGAAQLPWAREPDVIAQRGAQRQYVRNWLGQWRGRWKRRGYARYEDHRAQTP